MLLSAMQKNFAQYTPFDISFWSNAGYPGEIPYIESNVIKVTDNGVIADGTTDNYSIIQSLIDNTQAPCVLFFPAGIYRINGQLNLKSGIVLRGEGYQSTHLEFFNNDGCIQIRGALSGSYSSILGGLTLGSTKIVVSNVSSLEVGKGAHIRQGNVIETTFTSWVEPWSPGQMVRITAINGDTVSFQPALNYNYASNPPLEAEREPGISKVNFIEEVGIENLHIKRLHSTDDGGGSNINITRAANFWIRGVESEYTLKYHCSVSQSLNFEIRECYMHDAQSRGDGGQGYGVSLASQCTAGLIEDNIFYKCRHSMIVQVGVNGCVFGYNYAEKNFSDDGWDKPYISLHGHYVHRNLFEGNVVGWIGIGDYWGPDGPDNIFFRNHVLGTDRHEDFGDNRGIMYSDFDGPQYIIANEVSGGDIYYSERENSESDTSLVIIHGNNIKGNTTWEKDIAEHSFPASYYLNSKPAFFLSYKWPPFGGDNVIGTGTIPAWERWKKLTSSNDKANISKNELVSIKNPVSDKLILWSEYTIRSFVIIDINGKIVESKNVNDSYYCQPINILPGIYFIKVITSSGSSGRIFIKM